MSKSELRRLVLSARDGLEPAAREAGSREIAARLFALEPWRRAGTVMVYLNFRSEVATGLVVARALAEGRRVTVPKTEVTGRRLIASVLSDYPGDLAPGTWGILEPREECLRPLEPREIDLVLVPGVAFDPEGNRLGYGGGFYDRFLALLRSDAYTVAPAFEVQVVPRVETGPYDIPVDLVVTEKRVIDARAGRQGA